MNKNWMSESTKRNIGLQGILQAMPLSTPYGKELREGLQPFFLEDVDLLRKKIEEITLLKKGLEKHPGVLGQIKKVLKELKDLKGSLQRAMAGEALNEVELFEIKVQVMAMEGLRKVLQQFPEVYLEIFKLEPLTEILMLLDPEETGIKTFYLYDNYSEKLKELRDRKRKVEEKIFLLNKAVRQELERKIGVKPNLNGEIVLQKEAKDKVESLSNSSLVFLSGETLRSYIFVLKPSQEQQQYMDELEGIKDKEEEEEFFIRKEISRKIGQETEKLFKNIEAIGQLDLLMGKVVLAQQVRGVPPTIVDYPHISFLGGRQIEVEEQLRRKGKVYTPIDFYGESGVALITGANMGGKTVTLKCIALIMAMAQLGLYVPASEATIGPATFIYFSSGDEQSTEKGLSTFGAEIHNLKEMLERVDEGGLILIDELARGTNPLEGFGISKGIIEYMKNKRSISVLTTHFDGLSSVEGIRHLQVVGLKNIDLDILNKELANNLQAHGVLEKYMDYRLEERKDHQEVPKEALLIARLMGLKDEIIKEAERAIQKPRI